MNSAKSLTPSRSNLSAILKYIYRGRSYVSPSHSPGSGVGKGGGWGGSPKEPGAGLRKYGAVREDRYFYNKDRKQMEKIKQELKDDPQKEKARRSDHWWHGPEEKK